ncbi:MAG: hypothetical protein KC502_16060, partial [Myxococcales bacterium]|nr:hypothetical protein [Myxococcales bacterium]
APVPGAEGNVSEQVAPTLGGACRELGLELYEVLQGMDPARWREERAAQLRGKLAALSARASGIKRRYSDSNQVELLAWCDELAETTESDKAPKSSKKVDWTALRTRLTASYDRLNLKLRDSGAVVPHNRPTNYARNAYHIGNGLMILLLIKYVLTPTTMIIVAGAFVATAWSVEWIRRFNPTLNRMMMRAFRDVAHPHEHYSINSATWMVTALLLISVLFSPVQCAIGVVVLGFADPAAAVVGRRFGRHKLRGSKTLEGTVAFAVAGAIVAMLTASLWGVTGQPALMMALCAALPAAIAELYSGSGVDDNFSIPVIAATGAWLAQFAGW